MPVDNFQNTAIEIFTHAIPEIHTIWNSCLKTIQENVKPITYKTWFEPIKPIKLEDFVLTVQVPSTFFYEWLEEHYFHLIQKAMFDAIGAETKLQYAVVMPDRTVAYEPIVNHSITHPVNGTAPYQSSDHVSFHEYEETPSPEKNDFYKTSNLNPRYTFENFIRGDGNQFARAAALNVANNPGHTAFNPLVLYGGVGLGKTHLIQAIGNAVFENNHASRIVYISSEKFTIDFVEAIEKNKTKDFSDYFRNMDILIIDDIQFFSGKERTQENFFHTFNTLHQFKKQIILSCDRPPKEIKGLGERLLSRFQWGLTVDIQPPDLETRIAILRMKSEQENITLPQKVIEFMAANVKSNIRELEGCFITLIARHTLDNRPIDVSLAEDVLKTITTNYRRQHTVEQIQKLVAEYFNISENLMRAKTRKQEVVLARQIAMYLAKTFTSASLKTIGLHFGGRDHSTVIHACQNISSSIATDQSIHNSIQHLEKQLNLLST